MFGIDLVSLVVGCALGATFPAFFKMVWSYAKTTKPVQAALDWFSKK